MGIHSINSFLRKEAPQAFVTFPITNLSQHRIAIDGANWVFVYASAAIKDVVFKMSDPLEPIDRVAVMRKVCAHFLNFNNFLMNQGITPVWVWDGKSLEEKTETKEKRKKDKMARKEKINVMREELQALHILLRPIHLVTEFRKMLSTHTTVSSDEMELIKNLCSGLGIPSLQAIHDGEILCSQLAIEGHVKAVWSTDTDAYALGTPILITGTAGEENGTPLLEGVLVPLIRDKLGLNQLQLLDLCIMCGCDFNNNIPNIGPQKSFKLIKEFGCIENIATYKGLDVSILNHLDCREIFGYKKTEYEENDARLNLNKELFKERGRDTLDQYGLTDQLLFIINAMKRIGTPQNVDFKPKPAPVRIKIVG